MACYLDQQPVAVGDERWHAGSGIQIPRYQDRGHSEIHCGAVWLQWIVAPTRMRQGHSRSTFRAAGLQALSDWFNPWGVCRPSEL